MTQPMISLAVLGGIAALTLTAAPALADEKPWFPFKVEAWDPPFNTQGTRKTMDYVPLEKADKKWDICVSFPHMRL